MKCRVNEARNILNAYKTGKIKIDDLISNINTEGFSDALEKISKKHPQVIRPFKKIILKTMKVTDKHAVRWHMIQMLIHFKFDKSEIKELAKLLEEYFYNSESKIVKVDSLTCMVNLSKQYPELKSLAIKLYKEALTSPIPSLRARAKKLTL